MMQFSHKAFAADPKFRDSQKIVVLLVLTSSKCKTKAKCTMSLYRTMQPRGEGEGGIILFCRWYHFGIVEMPTALRSAKRVPPLGVQKPKVY